MGTMLSANTRGWKDCCPVRNDQTVDDVRQCPSRLEIRALALKSPHPPSERNRDNSILSFVVDFRCYFCPPLFSYTPEPHVAFCTIFVHPFEEYALTQKNLNPKQPQHPKHPKHPKHPEHLTT